LQETDASPSVVSFLTRRLLGDDHETISRDTNGEGIHQENALRKWLIPRIAAFGTVFSQNAFDIVFEAAVSRSSAICIEASMSNPEILKRKFISRMESDGVLVVNSKRHAIRWTHDKVSNDICQICCLQHVFMCLPNNSLLVLPVRNFVM
jgi:hypothetical protein